jgi:hypothetical protein
MIYKIDKPLAKLNKKWEKRSKLTELEARKGTSQQTPKKSKRPLKNTLKTYIQGGGG